MPRPSWGALEADLLRAGLTLEDYPDHLSLRALVAAFQYAVPGSAVYRHESGVKGEWRYTEELLALIYEAVQDGNWQRAGNRFAPRPHRLTRPGEVPEGTTHFGDGGMTIAEFNEAWKAA